MTDIPFENEAEDFEIDLGLPEPVEEEIDLNLDFGGPEEPVVDDIVIDLSEPEPEPEPTDELDADDEKVIEELRQELLGKAGDWYVVHTYSGMENRVKQNLDNRVKSLEQGDNIFESVVPTEDVVETRNNQKKTVTRTTLPGYVLVRMNYSNETWAVVRHTPGVTGFVSLGSSPVPLTLDEVVRQLTPSALARANAAESGPSKRSKKKVEIADYKVGDSVMVVAGALQGLHATITEINAKGERLKALVEILGRETPVDLTISQIQKI
ncbi:MAG: transcription termination/antitermination protein NusG [Propionibacteriaceae bacterium]|nr:transcription termination/antitermination protein NusG [Propionibacteriaceae bacterium]